MKAKKFKTQKTLSQKQIERLKAIVKLENELINNNINDSQFTLICKDIHNI